MPKWIILPSRLSPPSAEEEKVTLAKEKEKEQEICEWLEQRKELSLWWERSEQEGKRLKDVKKALETFFEGEEKLLKEQEILQQKEELCNQKIKSWEEARRRTEEKNRLYIASEAVFLAAKLREGIPCPVCGSLSHPSPASLSEEKVTEDELLACQESERTAEEEKNAAVLSVEKQRHRIALEKEQLEEKGRAILSEEGEYEGKTISEALLSYRLQKEEAYKRWQQERVSLQKQIQEKKEKEEALSVQKMVQKKREMSIEKMTECVMKLSQETKEKEAQKDLLKKQLTIVSIEEGQEKLNSLKTELSVITASLTKKEKESEKSREKYATISGKHKQMQTHMEALQQKLVNAEEKWQSLRQEYQLEEDTAYQEALVFLEGQEERKEALTAYRENRLKLDTRWDELIKRTKGKVFKGLDELQAHCQELTGLLETQKESFEKEQYLYRRDMQAVKRLRRLLDDRGAFWEEAKVFGALNDAANGRMHFQTYIQRYYFKQIIQAANRRLAKMSNSPFLLKCRELGSSGQGEIGLDLDVLNPVTGKVRDAHTLSGGETFLASLSLALGMADVVQNTVGKIQMETMFIDEGFGSLSEDVRNTAVRVLEELAGNNRLIGIISHVTELKEQIPDKLLVEKGKQGSHVRWVRE